MTDAAAATAAANGLGGPLGQACPNASVNPCDSVIVAQASYTYNSALSYLIQRPITMSAVVFSRPRAVFTSPAHHHLPTLIGHSAE